MDVIDAGGTMTRAFAFFVVATLLMAYQFRPARAAASPSIKQVSFEGVTLRYLDQGQGAAVVFVHGGVSDHRVWEHQREAIAKRYRFIAIDQRYFGPAPWLDDGALFSQATHVADLAAFIRALNVGPVYLVGQSYGAVIVLAVGVYHPDLVRGLVLNEPPLPSILTDPAAQKVVSEDRQGLVAVSAAARAGNILEATRQFIDWVNGQPGGFAELSAAEQTMHSENARTLPLQLGSPPPAPLTCSQLGQVKVPVLMTKGELTRSFFRVIVEAAHRCMPVSQVLTIPGARHGAPRQAPAAFNAVLLGFLARN